MKQIKNWKKATVCDIETDGLLDSVTKMHILYYHMANGKAGSIDGSDEPELERFLQWHIDNDIPIAGHNFIGYDVPAMEKIFGYNLEDLMVIDTMALSWYLNHKRKSHALATFLEDYGIAKVKVLDSEWEGLTEEEEGLLQRIEKSSGLYKELKEKQEQHKELMFERCKEDVAINTEMWKDFIRRLEDMYTKAKQSIDADLVGGKRVSDDEELIIDSLKDLSVESHINRLLTFLMFKSDCIALQEASGIKLDMDRVNEGIDELQELVDKAASELEAVLPDVPKYTPRKEPKNPKKKDGSLSAAGERWNNLINSLNNLNEYGHKVAYFDEEKQVVKQLKGYEPPNINSSDQIKDFLFSHGWEPETFKYVTDKEKKQVWADSGFRKELKPETRSIPQVSIDGEEGKELCPSVLKLADQIPEIKVYADYNMISNRLSVLKGFLRDQRDGYLGATAQGFTNTLRLKHIIVRNLPKPTKPFGELIRGVLISRSDKHLLFGSDLSGIEDRTKHHFMLPHDPDYVATMMEPDFDGHLLNAFSAGLISEKDMENYKNGIKEERVVIARSQGKVVSYSAVYGGSPEAIARGAGIGIQLAKKLHGGYWDLNHAVTKVADEQVIVVDSLGEKWLVNPINGFCYSFRKEADRFSTLNQGSASYIFDMWVDKVLTKMKRKFKKKTLSMCMHDEFLIDVINNEETKKLIEDITLTSIKEVKDDLKIRRDLDCDYEWGDNYAKVH